MKRSKIFLIGKMSERELDLFKKDLQDHSVQAALKIKNLNFNKEKIEAVAKNALDHVLLRYNLKSGNSLGDLVKMQVLADLRAEYEKTYPTKLNKVKWPDLMEKRPFKKLLEAIQKLKLLPKVTIDSVFEETAKILSGRQQKLLSAVFNMTSSVTYTELCEKFDISSGMISREIKIIYSCLIQVVKFLGIEI